MRRPRWGHPLPVKQSHHPALNACSLRVIASVLRWSNRVCFRLSSGAKADIVALRLRANIGNRCSGGDGALADEFAGSNASASRLNSPSRDCFCRANGCGYVVWTTDWCCYPVRWITPAFEEVRHA
jgi:hypothetical protein